MYGYEAWALQTCQLVEEVEFKGDFNIWSPIETLLLLETRVYREQQNAPKVVQVLEKIVVPMLPHEEAFRRRLSFNWLSDKQIAYYLHQKDVKAANELRFSDLSSLFFIRELGSDRTDIDSLEVNLAQAEQRIQEYIQILKQVK